MKEETTITFLASECGEFHGIYWKMRKMDSRYILEHGLDKK